MTLDELIKDSHERSRRKGWYEGFTKTPVLEKLVLIHSEISEVLEAYRDGGPLLEVVNGKPEGIAAEFADVLIRIADLMGALGLEFPTAPEIPWSPHEPLLGDAPLPVQLLELHSLVTCCAEDFETETALQWGLFELFQKTASTAARAGVDVQHALLLKAVYNETRPHRHGGKRC